jgi:hypothetical protein
LPLTLILSFKNFSCAVKTDRRGQLYTRDTLWLFLGSWERRRTKMRSGTRTNDAASMSPSSTGLVQSRMKVCEAAFGFFFRLAAGIVR